MRSFARLRLLSLFVLGLMVMSFAGNALAYVSARYTMNGSSAYSITVRNPTVRFDASSSQPNPTTYYWNFDGTTVVTTNPIIYHTFPQYANGQMNYFVTLTVYDTDGWPSTRTTEVIVLCSNYVPGGPPCQV
jgi:hypothetical protein